MKNIKNKTYEDLKTSKNISLFLLNNMKIFFILVLFLLFPINTTWAHIRIGRELSINDDLKICRLYSFKHHYELPNGWRTLDYNSADYKKTCNDLGYKYEKTLWEGEMTKQYKNKIIFICSIFILLSISYLILLINFYKKGKIKSIFFLLYFLLIGLIFIWVICGEILR
ncbi:hypothetical protein KAI92_04245 [Candidatus Parcubacteria bacterium]|nr:hypothetical protein [Candidatus Parcubacteria bacterium]